MDGTLSLWQGTRSFFPLFQRQLELVRAKRVCVVGASDGKFVLPLARDGYRVTAIEYSPLAIDGGPIPDGSGVHMPGLKARLAQERLADQVEIVLSDITVLADQLPHDGVWTSCSWHYSLNHVRPLGSFISSMQQLCAPDGIFGAEYMMPVEARHRSIEHYLDQGEILNYFPGWTSIWEAYTPEFTEEPHPEKRSAHRHRMGVYIARRTPAVSQLY